MKNAHDKTSKAKGSVFIISAAFLWGSSFIVTKGATGALPTVLLVAIRFLAGGIFAALLCLKQHKETTPEMVLASALLGLMFSCGTLLQTEGMRYTSAGKSAFLTAAYCMLMPFLEWKLMGNRPSLKNILSGIICIAGIGLVALSDSLTVGKGELITLAGSVCFALNIALSGIYVKKYDARLINMYMLITSGAALLVISLFTETIPESFDTGTVLSLIYLAVFCTGIPTLLQTLAVKEIPPTLVTVLLGFEPVFAAVISAVAAAERFSVRCLAGFALILLAVLIG